MANAKTEEKAQAAPEAREKLQCGIVMPIATMADYSDTHWRDVLEIIEDAITQAGLQPNLVSYTEESSIIHSTIVQNLYDNPVVVCDVSGKNPNVMFELGLRLAFDKPTIIIKDDQTGYSFDTGSIEHLPYPRDLRFSKIVEFKGRLTEKIRATLKASTDPNYTTFLKHFKRITVSKLEDKEVSSQEFLLAEIRAIRQDISRFDRSFSSSNALRVRHSPFSIAKPHNVAFSLSKMPKAAAEAMRSEISSMQGITKATISDDDDGLGRLLRIEFSDSASQSTIEFINSVMESLQG